MPDGDVQVWAQRLTELFTTWGLRVLGAIAVLLAGWLLAKWARRITRRAMQRMDVDATLVPFFANLVYALALTFVLIAVLGLFGIPTTSFVAVLGAGSLAVGLALQGTLSSFAAGVMLLLFRPFRVGDYIETGDVNGTVQTIGIFSTVLHTPDNVRIVVPNSEVYGKPIRNYSANETRRIDLVIGVGYDDDLQVAADTMRAVLEADERVLPDPAPAVAVSELGDSSVNFVVRPWCRGDDYWTLRFDLTRRLKEALDEAGCTIPYPQRDVHVLDLPGGAASARI